MLDYFEGPQYYGPEESVYTIHVGSNVLQVYKYSTIRRPYELFQGIRYGQPPEEWLSAKLNGLKMVDAVWKPGPSNMQIGSEPAS